MNEEKSSIWRQRMADDGYRTRFLAKARASGIHFSEEAERLGPSPRRPSPSSAVQSLAAVLAIAVLVAAGIGVVTYQRLKGQIERQRAQIRELDEKLFTVSNGRALLQSRLAAETRSAASLKSQFANLQKDRTSEIARANHLDEQLTEATTTTGTLQVKLAKSNVTAGELQNQLQADEQRLADLGAEAHQLKLEIANHADNTSALKSQVEQLSGQLRAAQKAETRYEQLLAAGKDIRDLMGARKLHVIDVFDANGEGKNTKVFGRVFYTEGRSLVFYAFNLGDAKSSSGRFSYVAWGKQRGGATPAKELGIFYSDDANQRRWVLRFDNPKVLREINAVFVTIEHESVSQQPTGQTLLYAYLHTPANHP